MSRRREPVNAAALLAGRVLGAFVALLVVSIAAYRLELDEFGLTVSIMAAGFLANTFVTFGTDTVITRAVAAGRGDARAVALVALRLQLALAGALVAAATLAFFVGANGALLIQAIALFPMAVITVAGAVLRGAQQMGQLLVATVTGAAFTTVVLFVGFEAAAAPWVPIAALAAGSSGAAVVTAFYAVRLLPLGTTSVSMLELAREAVPFAAMVLLAAAGAQGGLLLVEVAGDGTAGGYGVAVRLFEAARLVPAAAMGAFFPAMLSGLHHTARYQRWLRLLFVYAALATVVLVLLAATVNRIVFNEQPGGARLTQILALGLVVVVARLAMSFELVAAGHERVVLIGAVAGTATMLVAALALVGRFGAEGVAWSQLGGVVVNVGVLSALRTASPPNL